jgi:hypothetical protein
MKLISWFIFVLFGECGFKKKYIFLSKKNLVAQPKSSETRKKNVDDDDDDDE